MTLVNCTWQNNEDIKPESLETGIGMGEGGICLSVATVVSSSQSDLWPWRLGLVFSGEFFVLRTTWEKWEISPRHWVALEGQRHMAQICISQKVFWWLGWASRIKSAAAAMCSSLWRSCVVADLNSVPRALLLQVHTWVTLPPSTTNPTRAAVKQEEWWTVKHPHCYKLGSSKPTDFSYIPFLWSVGSVKVRDRVHVRVQFRVRVFVKVRIRARVRVRVRVKV